MDKNSFNEWGLIDELQPNSHNKFSYLKMKDVSKTPCLDFSSLETHFKLFVQ